MLPSKIDSARSLTRVWELTSILRLAIDGRGCETSGRRLTGAEDAAQGHSNMSV